jgi:competence protein ComEA
MQYLRPLGRNKVRAAAIILIGIGALVLAWRWIGPDGSAASEAPAAQDVAVTALEDEIEPATMPTAEAELAKRVIVYISGAVSAPDVYQLPATARVKDLVLAAGGLAPDADPERVNLAQGLSDGAHVHIPRQGETEATAGGEATGDGQAAQGSPVNINTASAADFDELPGIGQTLAQRILEYRAANGPFKALEDLRNVKGIGASLFTNIAPLLTVGS